MANHVDKFGGVAISLAWQARMPVTLAARGHCTLHDAAQNP